MKQANKNLKTLEWLVKVVEKFRERGCVRVVELEHELKIPHKTVYRVINCLRNARLIYKERNGKWYWFEYYRIYDSEEELKDDLNHSINIAKGLHALTYSCWKEFGGGFPPLDGLKYVEEAEEHLSTGYKEIHRIYKEIEKANKRIAILKSYFKEKLHKIFPRRNRIDLKILVSRLIDMLGARIGEPPFSTYFEDSEKIKMIRLISELGKDVLESFTDEEDLNVLRQFVEREIKSKEDISKACELLDLQCKLLYELIPEFLNRIELLIKLVENGRPLKGKCKICEKRIHFKK